MIFAEGAGIIYVYFHTSDSNAPLSFRNWSWYYHDAEISTGIMSKNAVFIGLGIRKTAVCTDKNTGHRSRRSKETICTGRRDKRSVSARNCDMGV